MGRTEALEGHASDAIASTILVAVGYGATAPLIQHRGREAVSSDVRNYARKLRIYDSAVAPSNSYTTSEKTKQYATAALPAAAAFLARVAAETSPTTSVGAAFAAGAASYYLWQDERSQAHLQVAMERLDQIDVRAAAA